MTLFKDCVYAIGIEESQKFMISDDVKILLNFEHYQNLKFWSCQKLKFFESLVLNLNLSFLFL